MDSKKIEILEKATEIFLRYGIKSVTMDDMARELGISKKTLYNYFKDKNDLVVQIISIKTEYDRCQCMKVKTDAENAIDELFEINRYVSSMMKNIHPSVFYDLKKFHSQASELLHQHKWKFVKETFLENIVRGKREGLYREDMADEIVATIYVGATDLISGGEAFAHMEQTSDQIFYEIIRFHMFGLVNEKGRKYLINRLKNEKREI